MISKSKQEKLLDVMTDAAIAGAEEIREFLRTYRGKDPDRVRRAHIAMNAMSNYTRLRSSQNNMVSMMLIAARQTGIGGAQTLEIAKAAGLLPDSVEVAELKAVK